jgi:hypothetical protein
VASDVALNILLKAQDTTGPAFKSTEGNLGKLGKAASVAWGAIGGAAASTAIGILGDAARAAAEDEANVLKLKAAVEASGASWDENSAAIEARIKAGQNLAFSDTDTRDSIAQLATATGDVNKAMDLQNLVMDIARGRNISLGAATDIAQKATLGQFGALKKLGIVLPEGATATEALGELQKRYAGQATAYGESTAGSIAKVKDMIGEWQESLGAVLGPAQGVIAMLPGLSGGMTIAGTAIGGLSSLIKMTFIPSLIALAIPFLPLILIIGAIGLAVGLLALAWSNNWGDIQGKAQGAVNFLLDIFDGLRIAGLLIWKALMLGIAAVINGVIGVINGFIEAYNGVAEKLGLPLIGKIELVTPNIKDIDAQINQIARDRDARINVVTSYIDLGPPGLSVRPRASGGDEIVTRPTLFLAGEAGAERVTVTSLAQGIGRRDTGGSPVVNITVQGSLIGMGVEELADAIGRQFTAARRLQGLA